MNNDTMPDNFFRDLDATEAEEFKQWARDNYKPGDPISGIWHPVIRLECARINAAPTTWPYPCPIVDEGADARTTFHSCPKCMNEVKL